MKVRKRFIWFTALTTSDSEIAQLVTHPDDGAPFFVDYCLHDGYLRCSLRHWADNPSKPSAKRLAEFEGSRSIHEDLPSYFEEWILLSDCVGEQEYDVIRHIVVTADELFEIYELNKCDQ